MVLAESSLFTSIGDLPLHPLVVHFAVVLLPLSALGLILIVIKPSWRTTFGWVVLAGLLAGAGAAFIAKESGEALTAYTGTPQEHADYGNILPFVAVLLFIVATAWFFVARKSSDRTPLELALAIAAVVLAIVATILTVVVGHTGAQAAWGGRLNTSTSTSTAPATNSSSGQASTPAATSGASSGITMADIANHASASDCWSAVNGNAYDLTQWIPQHPGGPGVIEGMCGGDGSNAFNNQHGGQNRPEKVLSSFLLGPVQG